MITRTFKLCLNAGTGSAPYINVNQYDRGEQWLFELYNEDGTRYTPSTGAIIGLKSDGHAIMNNGTVDSEGRVVITETEQMTAAAGRSVFELSIDGLTHGTANFIVKAERKPLDEGAMSDSDISMLQEVIDASEVINEVIGEGGDPSQRITDAVDDWLEAHPEATTTVQDGAITAPKINSSLWDKLLVSEEASGSVASFDDGADGVPVKSLKVSIDPVQSGSGDPSPTNIRPITGHTSATVQRTGKNLLNVTATTQSQNGLTFTVNADGTITVNGTATATTHFYFLGEVHQQWQTNGQALTFTGCPSGGNNSTYRIIGRTNSGVWISDKGSGANIPNTATYINNLGIAIQSGTVCNNLVFKPMARLSTVTDATFEPYTGNTYPYSLGQTVYGGTLDVATGVLKVTWGTVTLDGTESWQGTSSSGWYTALNSLKKYKSNYVGAIYADKLVIGRGQGAISGYYDNSDAYPTQNWLYYYRNTFTSANEVKSYFQTNPTQIVYELATPQTVQLTPQEVTTLLGENNIFADTGEVDVIYRADTKLYIDEQTKATKNIIAGVETSFTATKNYTVGNLLIVGDDLYRVTANIANGSAITPNTNVTKTTVAEQLLALA